MKNYTDILVGFGVLVLVVLGITTFSLFRGGVEQTALLSSAVSQGEWARGAQDSRVTLVEYSDFQCPACGAYYPVLKGLTEEFGDKVLFVYRNFPLSELHVNAEAAARAAEAAGLQGKFWEMHDLLFENQTSWSRLDAPLETFLEYASKLGLDRIRFEKDFASQEVEQQIRSDYQSGLDSQVTGTPTFFLNGKKIENPQSYEQFKALIVKELGN